jgi:hypothetical protein
MNYIEYIDLPSVPEHLIEPLQDIINKPPKNFSFIAPEYPFFKTRNVSDDLEVWLQTIFKFDVWPQYQLVFDGVPIHIDPGPGPGEPGSIDPGGRIFAYNYLLDTGGDNVKTAIYDKNNNLLQSEELELKRWHRINTGMPHAVHGINPDKIRIAISIGFNKSRFDRFQQNCNKSWLQQN